MFEYLNMDTFCFVSCTILGIHDYADSITMIVFNLMLT